MVQFRLYEDALIYVVDLNGKIVLSQMVKKDDPVISAADLSGGNYFIKIKIGDKVYTEKVLVE